MPTPPTPIAEKYVNCNGSTCTIGTAPNTATFTVMEGGYKRTRSVAERTNNTSLGEYEDVATIGKTTGTFKCAYVAGAFPTLDMGVIFATSITCPSGPSLTGNFRYNDIDAPVLDVQNGLVIGFTITNQGPTTFSITGP
jgi:hypothetical protein